MRASSWEMADFVSFPAAELTTQQAYDLMAGAIVPRPIAFVSTLGADGIPNLAPFSFFMAGGANPPSLAISINKGAEGRRKDTLRNIEDTHEFVVNLVTREMAGGMNATSKSYEPAISEWPDSEFTALPSSSVRPARVGESPIHFECRLYKVVDHGEGPGAAVYVIGEVLTFHLHDALLRGHQVIDFRPISRLGGPNYLDMGAMELFEMTRPSN